jgi:uncharacterized membrane protein
MKNSNKKGKLKCLFIPMTAILLLQHFQRYYLESTATQTKYTETRPGLYLMFVLAEIQNYIRMYHMYINIAGQCAVFD